MADIRVRVGQQNAVRVLSSAAGGSDFATFSRDSVNVIGGIGSITQLSVSGVSSLGSLQVDRDSVFDNVLISGVSTFRGSIKYEPGVQYGVAYYDSNYILSSGRSPSDLVGETNLIVTTDGTGRPSWSNVIDGGSY